VTSAGFGAKNDGEGREGPSASVAFPTSHPTGCRHPGAGVTGGSDRSFHGKPRCPRRAWAREVAPRFIIIHITGGESCKCSILSNTGKEESPRDGFCPTLARMRRINRRKKKKKEKTKQRNKSLRRVLGDWQCAFICGGGGPYFLSEFGSPLRDGEGRSP